MSNVTDSITTEKKERNKNRQSRHRNCRATGPVCVRKGELVQRVTRPMADKMVKEGWSFCPKSVWRAARKGDAPAPVPVAKKSGKKTVKKSKVRE